MSNLRKIITDTRRMLSMPVRHLQMKRLSAQGEAPISVLFYHRVADEHPNPWTIPCDLFQEQMDWIRDNFDLIDLQELQRRVRCRDSHRPAVHVTFDDGYAENCRFALPYLMRHKIPCTYFVTHHHVATGDPFPHDEKVGIPLPVNSFDELRACENSSIEIGFHTRTHPDCGSLTKTEEFNNEIVHGLEDFRGELGMPVRYFAFPYGMPQNMPIAAIQSVYTAGFDGFCSAFGAYNFPGQDSFHIRRIHGDAEMSRFKNWLTFDARKTRSQPEIRYWLPPAKNWQETLELVG